MSNWTFLNLHRVRSGPMPSDDTFGFNGAFVLRLKESNGSRIKVIASDGEGWQHVSVSLADTPNSTPSWKLMCAVKDLFLEPEDCVCQFHPPKSEYVNFHPGCLHLWKPIGEKMPVPPFWMVGPKMK